MYGEKFYGRHMAFALRGNKAILVVKILVDAGIVCLTSCIHIKRKILNRSLHELKRFLETEKKIIHLLLLNLMAWWKGSIEHC